MTSDIQQFSLAALRESALRQRRYAEAEEFNDWPSDAVLALVEIVEIVRIRRSRFFTTNRSTEETRLDSLLERFDA